MPIDYSRYPDNWEEIRQDILERAGHCCEFCGVANYAVGARDFSGAWHNERDIHLMNSTAGFELFGDFPDMKRIVLTIAHLDQNIDHNDYGNLAALCQACHLNHDREFNIIKAKATWTEKRYEAIREAGQLGLFDDN